MSRRDALLLRSASIWTVFIWVVFVRNLFKNSHGFGFRAVHLTLAAVSVAFAVGIWRIASRATKGSKLTRV